MLEEANASYEKVLELEPNNFEAIFDRGCLQLDTYLFDEALSSFDRVIELNPDWTEVYYEKAKLYFLLEDMDKAIEMIEKAFTIKPEDRVEYNLENDWEKIIEFLVNRQ